MRELHPEIDLRMALDDQVPEMRRRPRLSAGGVAHVRPEDTISCDACWCGRPNGHAWPGAEDGAPHPRYPE